MCPRRAFSAASGRARCTSYACATIAALAASLCASTALAGYVPYPGAPYDCDEQPRIFRSLKSGEFDFCRLRLRYSPGSRACLRIVTFACNVWVLQGPRWVVTRTVDEGVERIVCPPGPAPPSCPAGYDR